MYLFQAAAFLALPLLALAQQSTTTTTTSSASSQSSGTIIDVDVGKYGLVFSPDTVNASVGDQVRFSFYPQDHSVAQATFDAPCQYQDAGIFSGYMPVSSGEGSKIFTITINDTNAVWLYCSQGSHCQDGMVMVINPVGGTSETSLANFKAAAAKASTNQAGTAVSGGIITDNTESDSSSSSTSSASAASSAASSASARQSSASSIASAASSGAIVTGGTSTAGSAATAKPTGSSGASGMVEGQAWGTAMAGVLIAMGFAAWGLI